MSNYHNRKKRYSHIRDARPLKRHKSVNSHRNAPWAVCILRHKYMDSRKIYITESILTIGAEDCDIRIKTLNLTKVVIKRNPKYIANKAFEPIASVTNLSIKGYVKKWN